MAAGLYSTGCGKIRKSCSLILQRSKLGRSRLVESSSLARPYKCQECARRMAAADDRGSDPVPMFPDNGQTGSNPPGTDSARQPCASSDVYLQSVHPPESALDRDHSHPREL